MTRQRDEGQGAGQLPPHDLDAEASVLGACLLSAAAIAEVREVLTTGDFYKPSHAHVFGAICSLDDQGKPADSITVHTEVRRLGLDKGITVSDLTGLVSNVPAISSARSYAEIVAELARKRRLAGVGLEVKVAALDPTLSSAKVAEEAEARLLIAQGQRESSRGPVSAGDLASIVLDRAAAIEQCGDQLSGLPSGYADLDRLLGGMEPGSLVVVGARPSVGKTAFGLGIAEANASRGTPTLVISAEMAGVEVGARLVAMLSRVGTGRQRSGTLRGDEWGRLESARARLEAWPLEIDDQASPSVGDIRLRAKAMRARKGLGLVVVDYLQLVQGRATAERRELAVAEVARGLKALARDLGCVVVALAQLNRGLEARSDKRPLLADLRESGAIEQDADVVMFIYRDEVHNPASPDRGVAEIHVAKHRNGPTDVIRLAWTSAHARFSNLDERHGIPPGSWRPDAGEVVW